MYEKRKGLFKPFFFKIPFGRRQPRGRKSLIERENLNNNARNNSATQFY